jgi:hypothetical protein
MLNMNRLFIVALLIILFLCCFCFKLKAEEGKVRKSPIAGTWYPGDREKLTDLINKLLNTAKIPELKGRPFGIISPHAGIQWSGQAAAYGFKALKDKKIKRVILLGPSHYAYFKGIATSDVNFYETPLGKVKVDRVMSDELSKHPLFQGPHNAEMPEHCLEMEIPFLQIVLDDFVIVPLIVGDISITDYEKAASAIRKHLDDSSLIVVSSDFTHYGSRFGYIPFTDNVKKNLEQLDGEAIKKIISKDFDGYMKYIDKTGATICGAKPIGIFMKLVPPSSQGTLLNYYTSGDMLHDYTDTVSYASIIFTVEEGK